MISDAAQRAETDGGEIGLGSTIPGVSCSLLPARWLPGTCWPWMMLLGRGRRGHGGTLALVGLLLGLVVIAILGGKEKLRVPLDCRKTTLRTSSLISNSDLMRQYLSARQIT